MTTEYDDEGSYIVYEMRFAYDNLKGERAVEYTRTVVSDGEKLSQAVKYHRDNIRTKSANDDIDITVRREGRKENVNYH